MNKRKALRLVIGFLCCFLLGSMAVAISSDNYRIDWDVIAGSGGGASSASHTLRGTIGQTAIGSSSSADFQLGAGYWYGVAAPLPLIQIYFMTPDGEPYPFDVIISDGTWRKEFKNVTYIETEVPCNATYTFIYEQEGGNTIIRRDFSFSPGETRVFEFYTLPPVIEARTRPYIIYQEVGANASLTWDYDPANNTLNWTISKEAGKWADAGVAIDYLQEPSRYALRIMAPVGQCNLCCHMCLFLMHWFGPPPMLVETRGEYNFFALDPELGAIRIGYPLYNDAALTYPVTTTLRSIEGIEYYPEYTEPQYAVPMGNYILAIENLPENHLQFDLPLQVRAGKIVHLYNIYSPKIADLSAFTFSIDAEAPVAESSYSNLTHDEETNTLSIDVTTETDYDWWGSFVLPDSHQVKSILACAEGFCQQLSELTDYTVNRVEGYTIVVVRIDPTIDHISLTYEYRIYLPLVMKNYLILVQPKP